MLMEMVLPPTVFEKLVSKTFWLVMKAKMEMKRTGEPSSNLKPPVAARMRKFLVVGSLTLHVESATQLGCVETVEGGPNWRVARADEDARGHIVALSADEFLMTDGSRGLTHWQWPQNDSAHHQREEHRQPRAGHGEQHH